MNPDLPTQKFLVKRSWSRMPCLFTKIWWTARTTSAPAPAHKGPRTVADVHVEDVAPKVKPVINMPSPAARRNAPSQSTLRKDAMDYAAVYLWRGL